MSGYVPDWISAGSTVYFRGKPQKVIDYYFTSTPVHNSDRLVVILHVDGRRVSATLGDLFPPPKVSKKFQKVLYMGKHGRAYLCRGERSSVHLCTRVGDEELSLDVTSIPMPTRAQFCDSFEAVIMEVEEAAKKEERGSIGLFKQSVR